MQLKTEAHVFKQHFPGTMYLVLLFELALLDDLLLQLLVELLQLLQLGQLLGEKTKDRLLMIASLSLK